MMLYKCLLGEGGKEGAKNKIKFSITLREIQSTFPGNIFPVKKKRYNYDTRSVCVCVFACVCVHALAGETGIKKTIR